MHTSEGTLRAYLDGELDAKLCAAVAAHLRECGACRRQVESLASRASVTSQRLQAIAPRGAELPVPAPVALARLRARLAERQASASARSAPCRPERQTSSGGIVEMFKRVFAARYRAAWAGLAAALVVVSLLAFEPVRVAAGEFLGLFRVRKFAVVAINPTTMQDLQRAGGQIDKLLSDSVTFVKQPTEPIAVASAVEASQKAGIPIRLPMALSSAPSLKVNDGVDVRLKVDLGRVRAILDAAGRSDIKLPDSLDGADVEFIVPPMVVAQFDCGATQVQPTHESTGLGRRAVPELPALPSNCVVLMQLASPSVDAPASVDIGQVGEAMLQVLGLSPEEARHFGRAIDWSSTLVIPLPVDAGSFRDVTVDGAPGVLIESNPRKSGGPNRTPYTLFWQKNDIVYALSGMGDPTRGVEIANSLK